ncbi:MAG: hypothetical protein ACLSX5_10840 [Lachnospiraceae bacterium]
MLGNKKGTAAGRPFFEFSLENHCLFLTLRCIKRQCGTHAKIGSGIFMPFFLDFVPNCLQTCESLDLQLFDE